MLLFLKGIIVGIGKIMPGVSGAMLAINLNVYERLINAITSFFDDVRDNLKFLLLFGFGILIPIIFGSKIILYLFNNYKFITICFFLGLIIGGTYFFSKKIKYNKKNILFITIIIVITLIFCLIPFNYNLKLNNNIFVYFIGGYIEIFASIIPGISATSLLMMLGIYDDILLMVSNALNINYILSNISSYVSYILGMFISFIINIYLIKYLFKKYRNTTYIFILCLSLMSIIYLLITTLNISYTFLDITIGIILFIFGFILSKKLS